MVLKKFCIIFVMVSYGFHVASFKTEFCIPNVMVYEYMSGVINNVISSCFGKQWMKRIAAYRYLHLNLFLVSACLPRLPTIAFSFILNAEEDSNKNNKYSCHCAHTNGLFAVVLARVIISFTLRINIVIIEICRMRASRVKLLPTNN